MRRSRPSLLGSSKQVLLLAVLTMLLSLATVWGGRIRLRNSEMLTFAVGEADGPEARFAVKLAAMLEASSLRLHLRIIPNTDNAKALTQFDHKLADLAVLRTDSRILRRESLKRQSGRDDNVVVGKAAQSA